jgi:hypothetical protein
MKLLGMKVKLCPAISQAGITNIDKASYKVNRKQELVREKISTLVDKASSTPLL